MARIDSNTVCSSEFLYYSVPGRFSLPFQILFSEIVQRGLWPDFRSVFTNRFFQSESSESFGGVGNGHAHQEPCQERRPFVLSFESLLHHQNLGGCFRALVPLAVS